MPPDAALLEHLRAVVGPSGVVDDPAVAAGLLVDERRLYRGQAAIILKPASTHEVAAIVSACHRAGVGVVPQGGNTGYCGGATPDDSGTQVVVNLARMNAIGAVDTVGCTLTAGAGAILSDVQRAAAGHDLLFPLSMGSEGSCQIGGNLSTNAGGLAVLRYGTARDLALGIEAVLADGSVLDELKGLRKDNTGYDLTRLLVGAEGSLGIITAAVLRLFPRPRTRCTAFLSAASLEVVCALLARVRSDCADAASAFEYIGRRALDLVLAHVPGTRDPFAGAGRHHVLLELTSPASGAPLESLLLALLQTATARGEVVDAVLATSEAQARALWRLRESIPEAERQAGGSIKHDVSVAIDRIPAFCASATDAIGRVAPQARVSVYGHVGDGNVHFNVLAPGPAPDAAFRERMGPAVSDCVHAIAAGLRGSFSAEHGVGQLKRDDLVRYESPAALAAMRAVKRALDPRGIMNPGKVVAAGGGA